MTPLSKLLLLSGIKSIFKLNQTDPDSLPYSM